MPGSRFRKGLQNQERRQQGVRRRRLENLGIRFYLALMGRAKAGGFLHRLLGRLFLRTFPGHQTCRELEELVYAYHEKTLPSRQLAMFDCHMGLCAICQIHMESYASTVELGERLSGEMLAEDLPSGFIRAILAAREGLALDSRTR